MSDSDKKQTEKTTTVDKKEADTSICAEKIDSISLNTPLTIIGTLRNKGYLFYQLDDESKQKVAECEELTPEQRELVAAFLAKNGHVTLVGNFNKADKSSFGGKKSVRGTLQYFEALKINETQIELQISRILVYDANKVICALVEKVNKDDLLREDLPQDQGIAAEWYQGKSHLTMSVQAPLKPKHSNSVIQTFFNGTNK